MSFRASVSGARVSVEVREWVRWIGEKIEGVRSRERGAEEDAREEGRRMDGCPRRVGARGVGGDFFSSNEG